MTLRRSVSPDGRIDSLSVEFVCPVGTTSPAEVKACADATLKLQAEIVGGFLKTNGKPNGNKAEREPSADGPLPARLLKVVGMDTKWGRRLYIAVQANDQTLRLFGTEKQLAEAVTAAGFANIATRLNEGLALNLPCRITTKPSDDGRYTNIKEVLPATSP